MEDSTFYDPLCFDDSIRLIEFKANNSGIHPFRGQIVSARLSEHPSYSALSYVWGESLSTDPVILLDDESLRVTRSISDALSHLIQRNDVTRLWIDQISINQEDKVEKQQQVELMSRIFTQATKVIGWLGCAENQSQMAIDFLRVISHFKENDKLREAQGWQQAFHRLRQCNTIRRAEDLFAPGNVPIQAAAMLMRRPWFHRLWIVQEATLASTLKLHCGHAAISAQHFFSAVDGLCSMISDPPLPWFYSPFWHAHRIGQLRRKTISAQSHGFLHLGNILSTWECKHDQDRINALFGMVSYNNPESKTFRPCYDLTGPELYRTFMVDYIQRNKDLDALNFAGRGYCDKIVPIKCGQSLALHFRPPQCDVPSWVPDWRIKFRPAALIPQTDLNGNISDVASGTFASLDKDRQTLRVHALEVDSIQALGMPYSPSMCEHLEVDPYDIFMQWFALAKKTIPVGVVESLFASTMVMGGRVSTVDRDNLNISPEDIINIFAHWLVRQLPESMGHDFENWTAGLDESTRFGNLAEELARHRRFFVTEGGRLGLGPVYIPQGASIYVIPGARTPFIIECNKGAHVLVGDCYIHDLMDGVPLCPAKEQLLDLI